MTFFIIIRIEINIEHNLQIREKFNGVSVIYFTSTKHITSAAFVFRSQLFSDKNKVSSELTITAKDLKKKSMLIIQ